MTAPIPKKDAPPGTSGTAGNRVAIYAPFGQDGQLIADVLANSADPICAPDLDVFCASILEGAVGILTTEALTGAGTERLSQALREQPPWSDIPLVLLTTQIDAASYAFLAAALGNVVIIKRPLDAPSLVTVVKTAIRARQKQLQVRDLLAEAAEQQARIAALNDHLLLALDVAEMGTWEYNLTTGLRSESPGVGRLFGADAKPGVVTPEAWSARIHPDDRARVVALFDAALAGEAEYRTEYRACYADAGVTRWIAARAVVYRDDAGAPKRVIGVLTDITERKSAEEKLRQRQEEIQALNERLKRAMTETHHRVKNSLQLISAFVDMQANEHEHSVPVPELLRINAHVRTLAAVHDVLTHESKQGDSDGLVSAKRLLETLFPMIGRMTGSKRLSYEVEEIRLPSRQGTSLALVANELIINALKHSDSMVDVALRVTGDNVVLTVQDDGPGLPAGFQVEESSNTGLALVENLARWDLKGETSYENRVNGGGACIRTIMPLQFESELG